RFQAELDVLNAEVERFEESSRNTLQELVNIESVFDQSDEQILQGGRNEFNAILDRVEEQKVSFEALRKEIMDSRVNGVSVIDKQADMREIEQKVRETKIKKCKLTKKEKTLSREFAILRAETEKRKEKIDDLFNRGSLAEIYQTNAEETNSVRPSRINEKIAKLNLGRREAEKAEKNRKFKEVMKRLGESTKAEKEGMVDEEKVTGESSAGEKNEKEEEEGFRTGAMKEGSTEDFQSSALEEPLDGSLANLDLQKESLSDSVGGLLAMLRKGEVFSEEQFEKIFTEEFSNELAGMEFGEQEKKAVYEKLGHAAFGLRCSFGKRSHLVNEKYTKMVLDCARKNPGLTLTAGFLDFLKKDLDDLADAANRESAPNKKVRLDAVNKFVTENVASTLETLSGESDGVRWRVMALLARKDVEFSCSEETVGYIRGTLGSKERMKPSKFEEILAFRKIATEKCSKDAHREELAALLAGDKAFYQSLEDGDVTKAVSKAIGLKTIFSGALALLAAFPGRFQDQASLADDVAKEKANEVWAEFIEDNKQVNEIDREDVESIANIVEEDSTVYRCERFVSMKLLENIIGEYVLPAGDGADVLPAGDGADALLVEDFLRHRETLRGYVHAIFADMRGPGRTKDPVEFFDTLLSRDWVKELGHKDVVSLLETILNNQSEDFLAMLEKNESKNIILEIRHRLIGGFFGLWEVDWRLGYEEQVSSGDTKKSGPEKDTQESNKENEEKEYYDAQENNAESEASPKENDSETNEEQASDMKNETRGSEVQESNKESEASPKENDSETNEGQANAKGTGDGFSEETRGILEEIVFAEEEYRMVTSLLTRIPRTRDSVCFALVLFKLGIHENFFLLKAVKGEKLTLEELYGIVSFLLDEIMELLSVSNMAGIISAYIRKDIPADRWKKTTDLMLWENLVETRFLSTTNMFRYEDERLAILKVWAAGVFSQCDGFERIRTENCTQAQRELAQELFCSIDIRTELEYAVRYLMCAKTQEDIPAVTRVIRIAKWYGLEHGKLLERLEQFNKNSEKDTATRCLFGEASEFVMETKHGEMGEEDAKTASEHIWESGLRTEAEDSSKQEKLMSDSAAIKDRLAELYTSSPGDEEIKKRFEQLRKDPKQSSEKTLELFSLCMYVLERRNGNIRIRDTQLLSALAMIQNNEEKGWLAQINTGEGKTIIVALMAGVLVGSGRRVDIVTSSPELIKPIPQVHFFNAFGIRVEENVSNKTEEITKDIYANADVIYGTAGSFEGDILRDEFRMGGIRMGREFDAVIVDEVDNMLVDNRSHVTMLSSEMPGMRNLELVYLEIWRMIGQVAGTFIWTEDNKLYIKPGKNEKEVLAWPTDDGDGKSKNETFIELTRECITGHMNKVLTTEKTTLGEDKKSPGVAPGEGSEEASPKIQVPAHLFDLLKEVHLASLVDSAINARYIYQNKKHYKIGDTGKIFPLDDTNTGTTQRNMNWTSGLHQFLQLKHGAELTPESLSSNFISNVEFFTRYGKNIFGLSGTVGGDRVVGTLKKFYNIGSFVVPPHYTKRHIQMKGLVSQNTAEWSELVMQSIEHAVLAKRAVLVIIRYVADAVRMEETIKSYFKGHTAVNVMPYTCEEQAHVVQGTLKGGDIVVATNIAGRGTDFKLSSEVQERGGLHVVLTFHPPNKRIEEQNIGRASRSGQMGTSQVVVVSKEESFEAICEKREKEEEKEIGLICSEMHAVCLKDRIFKRFCGLNRDVKEILEKCFSDEANDMFSGDGEIGKTKEFFVKKHLQAHGKKFLVKTHLQALEENFAVWVRMNIGEKEKFDTKESVDKKVQFFESDFCDSMKDKASKTTLLKKSEDEKKGVDGKTTEALLVRNPYFFVLAGRFFTMHAQGVADRYDIALLYYDRALGIDKSFCDNVYYNKGVTLISQIHDKASPCPLKLESARLAFSLARSALKEKKLGLMVLRNFGDKNVLGEHIDKRIRLLSIQEESLDNAIRNGEGYAEERKKVLVAELKTDGVEKEIAISKCRLAAHVLSKRVFDNYSSMSEKERYYHYETAKKIEKLRNRAEVDRTEKPDGAVSRFLSPLASAFKQVGEDLGKIGGAVDRWAADKGICVISREGVKQLYEKHKIADFGEEKKKLEGLLVDKGAKEVVGVQEKIETAESSIEEGKGNLTKIEKETIPNLEKKRKEIIEPTKKLLSEKLKELVEHQAKFQGESKKKRKDKLKLKVSVEFETNVFLASCREIGYLSEKEITELDSALNITELEENGDAIEKAVQKITSESERLEKAWDDNKKSISNKRDEFRYTASNVLEKKEELVSLEKQKKDFENKCKMLGKEEDYTVRDKELASKKEDLEKARKTAADNAESAQKELRSANLVLKDIKTKTEGEDLFSWINEIEDCENICTGTVSAFIQETITKVDLLEKSLLEGGMKMFAAEEKKKEELEEREKAVTTSWNRFKNEVREGQGEYAADMAVIEMKHHWEIKVISRSMHAEENIRRYGMRLGDKYSAIYLAIQSEETKMKELMEAALNTLAGQGRALSGKKKTWEEQIVERKKKDVERVSAIVNDSREIREKATGIRSASLPATSSGERENKIGDEIQSEENEYKKEMMLFNADVEKAKEKAVQFREKYEQFITKNTRLFDGFATHAEEYTCQETRLRENINKQSRDIGSIKERQKVISSKQAHIRRKGKEIMCVYSAFFKKALDMLKEIKPSINWGYGAVWTEDNFLFSEDRIKEKINEEKRHEESVVLKEKAVRISQKENSDFFDEFSVEKEKESLCSVRDSFFSGVGDSMKYVRESLGKAQKILRQEIDNTETQKNNMLEARADQERNSAKNKQIAEASNEVLCQIAGFFGWIVTDGYSRAVSAGLCIACEKESEDIRDVLTRSVDMLNRTAAGIANEAPGMGSFKKNVTIDLERMGNDILRRWCAFQIMISFVNIELNKEKASEESKLREKEAGLSRCKTQLQEHLEKTEDFKPDESIQSELAAAAAGVKQLQESIESRGRKIAGIEKSIKEKKETLSKTLTTKTDALHEEFGKIFDCFMDKKAGVRGEKRDGMGLAKSALEGKKAALDTIKKEFDVFIELQNSPQTELAGETELVLSGVREQQEEIRAINGELDEKRKQARELIESLGRKEVELKKKNKKRDKLANTFDRDIEYSQLEKKENREKQLEEFFEKKEKEHEEALSAIKEEKKKHEDEAERCYKELESKLKAADTQRVKCIFVGEKFGEISKHMKERNAYEKEHRQWYNKETELRETVEAIEEAFVQKGRIDCETETPPEIYLKTLFEEVTLAGENIRRKNDEMEMLKDPDERLKLEKGVIEFCRQSKREIRIEFTALEKCFGEDEDYEEYSGVEREYEKTGFMGKFTVTDVSPVPWASFFSLLALGIVQVVVGGFLTVFTCGVGASMGTTLISEGINDIISAFRDILINRTFDWAYWITMKLFSLVMAFITAGMAGIKDMSMAASKKSVQCMKTFGEGVRLMFGAIGIEAIKTVISEVITWLADDYILKNLYRLIQDTLTVFLTERAETILKEQKTIPMMEKNDEENERTFFTEKITARLREMLRDKTEEVTDKYFKGISSNIGKLKSVLQKKHQERKDRKNKKESGGNVPKEKPKRKIPWLSIAKYTLMIAKILADEEERERYSPKELIEELEKKMVVLASSDPQSIKILREHGVEKTKAGEERSEPFEMVKSSKAPTAEEISSEDAATEQEQVRQQPKKMKEKKALSRQIGEGVAKNITETLREGTEGYLKNKLVSFGTGLNWWLEEQYNRKLGNFKNGRMMDALRQMKDPTDPKEQRNSIIPQEVFDNITKKKEKELREKALEDIKKGRMLGINDMEGIGKELVEGLKNAAKEGGDKALEEQVAKHGVVFMVEGPDGKKTRVPPTADPNAFEILVKYDNGHYSSVNGKEISMGNAGENDCLIVAAMESIKGKTGIDLGKENPDYIGGIRNSYANSATTSRRIPLQEMLAQIIRAGKSKKLAEGGDVDIIIPDSVFKQVGRSMIQIEELTDVFMNPNPRNMQDLDKLIDEIGKKRRGRNKRKYGLMWEKLKTKQKEDVYAAIATLIQMEIGFIENNDPSASGNLLVSKKTPPATGNIIDTYHQEHTITTKKFGSAVFPMTIKGVHSVGGSIAQTMVGHGRPELLGLLRIGNTAGLTDIDAKIKNFVIQAKERQNTLALIQKYCDAEKNNITIHNAVQESDAVTVLDNLQNTPNPAVATNQNTPNPAVATNPNTQNPVLANLCCWNLKENQTPPAQTPPAPTTNRITSTSRCSPIMTTFYQKTYFSGGTGTAANVLIEGVVSMVLASASPTDTIVVFERERKVKMIALIDAATRGVRNYIVV
ncbi:MAG: protein translocase subunit SecA-like protein, partial [Amphiamblys sp. WSBS2006]